MHFLRLKKGWANVHSKANIQHTVLHIHEAKDVNIIRRNRKHLRQEVPQQVIAASLPPSKFNELLGCDVWKIYSKHDVRMSIYSLTANNTYESKDQAMR